MSLRSLVANVQLMVRVHSVIGRRYLASNSKNQVLESVEEEPVFLSEADNIETKRNKSRLNIEHRNIINGRKPYDEPMAWYHNTVRYKRRILGRYGMEALGVPAGLAWPTREEVEDAKEWERVAYPQTIQQTWRKIAAEKKKKEEDIMARQEKIAARMATMGNLIASVKERVAKKQMEAEQAILKKQRRLDEIRKQLRATGTVTTAKMNEMLETYEKEDKKRKKEAKKQRQLERQKQYLATNMPIEKPAAETSSESREGSPAAETTPKT
ncbi:growth arrest and DNA damage-inducible proteins-interacting protein CRIF [Lasioglossum baleicum]|uniref:growth arrest and DNA damage-inducible proteins-interacting protein CRIF n=1 Tax=Lasioglossum baleicum TaxID=434251 RepID=UPI003FCD86E7